jgi:hypothetical protein
MSTRYSNQASAPQDARRYFQSVVTVHFWFKCFGTMGFTFVFFAAYVFLLNHPAFPVTLIPITSLDRMIGIEPLALPLYLSLWLYVSLPPMLMMTRRALTEYGLWIGALCLSGLAIFYFWPTAIPASHVDWARYPGMAFLKGVDAAGNACPSLHVATAVFSCFWLNQQLRSHGLGLRWIILNVSWCTGIVYSTMATKQHMALDVFAGIGLALIFAWACNWARQTRKGNAGSRFWIGYGAAEPD